MKKVAEHKKNITLVTNYGIVYNFSLENIHLITSLDKHVVFETIDSVIENDFDQFIHLEKYLNDFNFEDLFEDKDYSFVWKVISEFVKNLFNLYLLSTISVLYFITSKLFKDKK